MYITLKKVEAGNKQATNSDGTARPRGGSGGRREGWLARAKISNKKTRKVSVLVSKCERQQFIFSFFLLRRESWEQQLVA